MDAANVIEDVLNSWEPQGWDSKSYILPVRQRFAVFNWKLDWNPKTSNRAAHAAASFTYSSS